MTVNKAVSLRIKELLKEKNMTQYRLEQDSGICHGAMASIMNDRNKTVTFTTIFLLARGFNMTILEFLDSPLFEDTNINI